MKRPAATSCAPRPASTRCLISANDAHQSATVANAASCPCLAVLVEPAAGLAAEPSCLDVLAPQRAGPELRIAEAVVQHLEDRQAGVEADQIGQRQRDERVAHAEPHDRVDRLGISDALV